MNEPPLDFERLYEHRHAGVPQERRQATWDVIAPWIWARMGSPRTVLDPAAGRCEFVNALPDDVKRWVVDIGDHAEWRDPAVTFVQGDIRDAELPAAHFDGIFVSNFLEHLPSQEAVTRFLQRMAVLAAPGGRITVMGPNFRYCAKSYFDFADHVVALTHHAVVEHLTVAGWDVVDVVPRFLPYSFGSRLPTGPALVRAYLRTPPGWRVLGKQFLVTAVAR